MIYRGEIWFSTKGFLYIFLKNVILSSLTLWQKRQHNLFTFATLFGEFKNALWMPGHAFNPSTLGTQEEGGFLWDKTSLIYTVNPRPFKATQLDPDLGKTNKQKKACLKDERCSEIRGLASLSVTAGSLCSIHLVKHLNSSPGMCCPLLASVSTAGRWTTDILADKTPQHSK